MAMTRLDLIQELTRTLTFPPPSKLTPTFDMSEGNDEWVISEKFIEVGEPPFFIAVLAFWFKDEPDVIDVLVHFRIREESLEVGISKRVVVG